MYLDEHLLFRDFLKIVLKLFYAHLEELFSLIRLNTQINAKFNFKQLMYSNEHNREEKKNVQLSTQRMIYKDEHLIHLTYTRQETKQNKKNTQLYYILFVWHTFCREKREKIYIIYIAAVGSTSFFRES